MASCCNQSPLKMLSGIASFCITVILNVSSFLLIWPPPTSMMIPILITLILLLLCATISKSSVIINFIFCAFILWFYLTRTFFPFPVLVIIAFFIFFLLPEEILAIKMGWIQISFILTNGKDFPKDCGLIFLEKTLPENYLHVTLHSQSVTMLIINKRASYSEGKSITFI